ncbi:MAG: SGNH/GDSL hydrolase family protein [Siphonobacter sp.]
MKFIDENQEERSSLIINRRTFLYSCLSAASLVSCKTKSVESVEPVVEWSVACFGDSLTAGAGGTPYPALLQYYFKTYSITNYGVGGQRAQEIAVRQGGIPIYMSIEGEAFNGLNNIKITSLSNQFLTAPNDTQTETKQGTLNGIACIVTRTATLSSNNEQLESYVVRPIDSSIAAIPADSIFIPEEAEKSKSKIQILWMGRNDVPILDDVAEIIDQCVEYINTPRRFVIIGILNALSQIKGTDEYDIIKNFNDALAVKYSDHYVAATPPTEEEMDFMHYAPSEYDLIDIENGTFPRGMHADDIHLNTYGYQLIANRVADSFYKNSY